MSVVQTLMNKEEEVMYDMAAMPAEGIIKDKIISMMNKESIEKNVLPVMLGMKMRGEEIRKGHVPTDDTRTKGMKDVAVVPALLVNNLEGGSAKVLINTDIMEACGITKKEIFSAAYKNLDSQNTVIRSMVDLERVFTMPGGFDAIERLTVDDLTDEDFQMYFVTNESGFFGAMSLFGSDMVKKIGDKLGDYFIIPSSNHEMIILKKSELSEPVDMIEMIRQINDNVVDEKDVLSYELYQYDADTGKVITCEAGNMAERLQDSGMER